MGRSPCCDKNGMKKGPWTPEEDEKLMDYIQKNGYGNWRTLPKNAGLQRCGKSCRLRWTNYLRPDIKRGRFSFEEEEIIIQLHSVLGNKWSTIAARLPGRTDNEIKNYWNTHIRKKLLRNGIDPVTHNPRLDLLDPITLLTSSSLYNSSHITNMISSSSSSNLLGFNYNLLNPELLRLLQTGTNFVPNDQLMSLLQQPTQIVNNTPDHQVQEIPQFSRESHQPMETTGDQFSSFDCQLISDWQCSEMGSNFPVQSYGYNYGSGQENSDLQYSNNSNNNFSFTSVMSTPTSSSPITPLSSSCIEDERENMFKFYEISDISNAFM